MKPHLTVFLFLLPLLLHAQTRPDTLTQYWHTRDKPAPTAKDVLLKVIVYDFAGGKVPGMELWAIDEKTQKVWRGFTGSYGEVFFLLPKGKTYRIDAASETGLKTVSLPDKRNESQTAIVHCRVPDFKETIRQDTVYQTVSPAQLPTHERVLVHLQILDLQDKPLDAEILYFAAKKAGKVYVAQTNALGDAYLMLPKAERFCLSTRFDADIKCFDMPDNDMAGKLNLTFNTIGSVAILRRQAERARQLAVRDSIFEARRLQDSLRREEYLLQDFVGQLERGDSLGLVQQHIDKRAGRERDSIARDEHFFEKQKDAVRATLYRMRSRWAHKVIVTDMTCSMEPYLDQVLLWHALRLVKGEENRYIFFNDGDGKTQEQKITGQTGGLHFTEKADMPRLLQTMRETKRFGCSGDGPENDLEALLDGAHRRTGSDELILIADNYSDVRDIELLTQLQVPVHIILCGTDFGVNEQYLEIAWKTHGSVHTIEQDIDDLTEMADGATISIGTYKYHVCRGKFIQVEKL